MSQTHTSSGRLKRMRFGLRRAELRKLSGYLFLAPAVIFIVLVMVYPLAYNLYLSLHDVTVGNFVAGTAPFVGLEKYRDVIGNPTFMHSLWVSLLFTAG